MEAIEFANVRKRAAQRKRKNRKWKEALALVDEAIQALDTEWRALPPAALISERGRKLAEALGDAYGTKGGILRSYGKYDQSCAAYDAGYGFESDERYRFANSYNLTQRLVARFLAEPERFEQDEWKNGNVVFPDSLVDAEGRIREQMSGPRLNDPWAMADRALLLLLLLHDEPEEQKTWRQIVSITPPAYVFSSTLSVIDDLRKQVQSKLGGSMSPRVAAIRARLLRTAQFLARHGSTGESST